MVEVSVNRLSGEVLGRDCFDVDFDLRNPFVLRGVANLIKKDIKKDYKYLNRYFDNVQDYRRFSDFLDGRCYRFSRGYANELMRLVGIDVKMMNFYLNRWYELEGKELEKRFPQCEWSL